MPQLGSPTLSAQNASMEQVVQRFPWIDYGTFQIPDSWVDIMLWARFLWAQHGEYRQAMKMVAAFFITELEFDDLDDEERTSYQDFFSDDLNFKRLCLQAGTNFLCYGEAMATSYIPISRSLRCSKCYFEQPIAHASYDWKDYRFFQKGKCPVCGNSGQELERVDRKDKDMSKMRVNFWEPDAMQVVWNRISEESEFWLRIPADLKRQIRDGIPVVLKTIPWEFVDAVRQNYDLKFKPDMVFHDYLREIAGLMDNGRGLPPSMANFRQHWQVQVLKKQEQAVSLDYITGLRLYSPAAGGNQAANNGTMNDPVLNRGGSNFVGEMNRIFSAHRMDPTKRYTAPGPVNYQFTGGEGAQISPYQIIQAKQEELLHSSGVPMEFYRLNLTGQGAPMMLRMFEMMWSEIPELYNRLLQWIVDKQVEYFRTEPTRVQMKPSHIADDLERKQALLQLMAGNQVSPATALAPYGINDIRKEIRRVFEHQMVMSEEEQRFNEEMAKKEEAGVLQQTTALPGPTAMAEQQMAAAGGGDPAAGGAMPPSPSQMAAQPANTGGGDTSMADLEIQAEQIAAQLVSMPYEARRPELKAIKDTNKALHSMVKAKMEELRTQAKNEGGYQILQGGGAAGPAGGTL